MKACPKLEMLLLPVVESEPWEATAVPDCADRELPALRDRVAPDEAPESAPVVGPDWNDVS